MATIKAQPGKLTQARARAEKMANKTGRPVSLLHRVQVHGGKYGTGKLRTVWTTYDTVYPSTKSNPKLKRVARASSSTLLPAKVRINPRTGKVQVFVSPKVAAQVKSRSNPKVSRNIKYVIDTITRRTMSKHKTGSAAQSSAKKFARKTGHAMQLKDDYGVQFTFYPDGTWKHN